MNKDLKVAINTKIKCNKKLSYHLRVNALIVISIIRLLFETPGIWKPMGSVHLLYTVYV